MYENKVDVLIIGAGIAGLIAANRLAQAGMQVLLVEKLSFLGGRFSAFPFQGSEISSGAFHTFPHGFGGPMGKALRHAGVQIEISRPKVVGSFFFNNRHIICKTALGLFTVLSTSKEKIKLCQLLLQLHLQKHHPNSFGDWLVKQKASPFTIKVFDRFCQFSLSTSIFSVPYEEGRYIFKHTVLYGLPGVPIGGARNIVRQLSSTAISAGVVILKTTEVERLTSEPHTQAVGGALLFDRRKKNRFSVKVSQVISTIGLSASDELLQRSGIQISFTQPDRSTPPAIGLKVHVLSPKSLISHDSIMFCLDTQRVAGIIQASNADPNLAPPGKHLLISHQTIQPGADWRAEKVLAIQDWEMIFGDDFSHCEVLGASQFPETYPVNWATQGLDIRTQPLSHIGFWLAGDAAKPQGLMMVEGVAASAELVSDRIVAQSSRG